mmetsp:Transcript_26405/g.48272  ORF Transcript_26405/g.48272 Transcript_26405/m.48272 type:complete len:731 (-) Transcript_26405:45-2237(-)
MHDLSSEPLMETQPAPAVGAAGGSFWSTFTQSSEVAKETCLEKALEDDPLGCSVAFLLDEEDIIQEFKTGNDVLMQRLVQEDALKFLIELLTEEPPEGASAKRCYREPFVASELLACGTTKLTRVLTRMDSTSRDLLDQLFKFLDDTAHRPFDLVNPTLVGYFSRVVCALTEAHPDQMDHYIDYRGQEVVRDRLLACVRWPSLAEYLCKLVLQEEAPMLPLEGLVMRLLRCLRAHHEPGASPSARSEEVIDSVAENVQYVITELLRKADAKDYGFELVRQATEAEAVDILVECALDEQYPAVVSAALNILVDTVFHGFSKPQQEVLRRDGTDAPEDSSHSKVAQHPFCAAGLRMLQHMLTKFLPAARACLDRCIHGQKASSAAVTPMGKVSSVGTSTLDVINCLSMLAMTGWIPLLKGLREEDLLARCLEIFFGHPWSSLLHNSTQMFFATVMEIGISKKHKTMHTPEEHREELKCLIKDLVVENGLLDRIVAEFEEERKFEDAEQGRSRCPVSRVGYMGHLHAMLAKLQSASAGLPDVECVTLICTWSGFPQHVFPAMMATRKTQEAALGGGVTERDRGMASSSQGGGDGAIKISSEDLLDEPINLNAPLGNEPIGQGLASDDTDWQAIDQAVEVGWRPGSPEQQVVPEGSWSTESETPAWPSSTDAAPPWSPSFEADPAEEQAWPSAAGAIAENQAWPSGSAADSWPTTQVADGNPWPSQDDAGGWPS